MAQAQKGDTVRVHYTGRFENGEVFDSSAQGDPLEFTVGAGQIIPGFEAAVLGMETGEVKTIEIPAVDAYGLHRPEMAMQVNRTNLPPDLDPQVGQVLEVNQEAAGVFQVVVTEVTEEAVTLDANHPLAGKDLTFEIRLVEVV